MTPEQKQRIEQIEDRRMRRYRSAVPPLSIGRQDLEDIDFLLSLVKSQEAEPFYMLFSPCADGEHSDCIEYSNGLRRDGLLTRCSCPCHRPELPDQMERDAMIETISELERERDIAATSMRSACVEKVRAMISVGDGRGWDDGYGQVWRQGCTEIITALESLSIEKPKE